ncbi:MAG: hypothetical protein IKJ63_04950 [Clostridia bacterium]|nr:hypothetical protein [Clostridia bacterium]
MNIEEWEKLLYEQDRNLLVKNQLPEHDELLGTLRALIPTTGNLNEMFCNIFFSESVELIKHAFFLYEDGYFDCAFYSLRQSIENMNNMLLSAVDAEKFEIWKEKGRFPTDKAVKDLLSQQNDAYNEIKTVIPEFFEEYNELLKKANKYIHKQGFDTFYVNNNTPNKENKDERTNLFISFLKYAIGMRLIMNIALDPLSLALSDFDVDYHIPFEPMTEPIPIKIFEKYLTIDIIEKIKTTEHYTAIKDYFLGKEKLNDATYAVLRYDHFDVEQLDEIEKQINQLDLSQTLLFCILKSGIKATHFYWDYGILGYSTSYQPKVHLSEHRSNQFDEFLHGDGKCNHSWKGMYISVFKALDSYLIIQHDEPLKDDEITSVKYLVEVANQRYQNELSTF